MGWGEMGWELDWAEWGGVRFLFSSVGLPSLDVFALIASCRWLLATLHGYLIACQPYQESVTVDTSPIEGVRYRTATLSGDGQLLTLSVDRAAALTWRKVR